MLLQFCSLQNHQILMYVSVVVGWLPLGPFCLYTLERSPQFFDQVAVCLFQQAGVLKLLGRFYLLSMLRF